MHVTPKFSPSKNSFHLVLKSRVNEYFQQNNISATGNHQLFTKAVILFSSFLLIYVHLLFFTPAWWLAVIEAVLLGGLVASIGFNIMHDGAHGSFSSRQGVNRMAAFSLNILGGSDFMWNVKHNIIHHAYTNIDGVDDDLDARPFLRMASTQKKYFIHKFQHFYFWFIYCFLYLYWIFFSDFQKYFSKKIGDIPLKKMSARNHFDFWIFKVVFYCMFIVLPIIMLGFLPWLIGFLIFSMVAGFVLSIVFQLAHTVEHTHFPMPDEVSNKLEDEWAIHQLKTTANFATNSRVISWLLGGLNFQVEHHLFPKISHIHYPAISKIIKEVCKEYEVEYFEYRKMRQAVVSHIIFLKQMGRAA